MLIVRSCKNRDTILYEKWEILFKITLYRLLLLLSFLVIIFFSEILDFKITVFLFTLDYVPIKDKI